MIIEKVIIKDIIEEYKQAISKHGPMASAHEGYAVIKEEVDELWDEIKKKHPDPANLREEAIQIAAMGIRFVVDCTEDTTVEPDYNS